MALLDFLLLIVLLIVLVKSADFLEDGFITLAKILRISPFVIGFVVLSLASSLPEITVTLNSAADNVTGLAVGNLLGATLVLITLLVAVNAIKHGSIPFKGSFGIVQLEIAALILVAQVVVLLDGRLGFGDGLLLVFIYICYVIYIIRKGQHKSKLERPQMQWQLVPKTILGILGLVIASSLIVDVAVNLATVLQVRPVIVGLLILGIGTNLPEIIVALRSNDKNKEKLAAGNVIGSASVNTGTLGLLGILAPGAVNLPALMPVMLLLPTGLALFVYLARTGREITHREGFMLVGLYLSFIITQLILVLGSDQV